jgi:hypothetical protein
MSERETLSGAQSVLAKPVLQGTSDAQSNEFMPDDVLKRDTPMLRKWIGAGDDHNEPVDRKGQELQDAVINRVRDDTDIGNSACDCLHDFGTQTLLQVDVHSGMTGEIRRE